jgi:hypothetical protein
MRPPSGYENPKYEEASNASVKDIEMLKSVKALEVWFQESYMSRLRIRRCSNVAKMLRWRVDFHSETKCAHFWEIDFNYWARID